MTLGIGVVGLGVQGRRMLARLAEHGGFRAVAGWDPDPESARLAAAEGVRLAATADAVIGMPGVDCLFIASPPASHMALANRAFDRGLAVFCEKPLAVDAGEARAAIARIAREGHRGAVNFSLASSEGLRAVQEALAQRLVGELREVRIEVAFSQWPRAWQAAGPWLARREEGGFTREVLSHFIFVLQRALGRATVAATTVTYPRDGHASETVLESRLTAGSVPVHVRGHVGGDEADSNRFVLVGDRDTLELREWLNVRSMASAGVAQRAAADARPSYLRQLDQLAAFIRGEPHRLPDFAEALAVQETIEALLAAPAAAPVSAPAAP